jgi:signal peptidase II
MELGQSIPEDSFFHMTYVRNTGAAFGLFSDQSRLLMVASIVAVVILLAYAIFLFRRLPLLNHIVVKIGTGLILGGTVGNLIDRIFLGYVTDFIGVSTLPIFNIADACITAGVVVFACYLIVQAKLMDARDEQCV